MAWITPITDWEATDYYNHSDLSRVESNTSFLNDLFVLNGYSPATTTFVTSRTNAYIDYYDSLNRIEANILALKECSFQPLTWSAPKTTWVSVIDAFSYIDANRLETNLSGLKAMIDEIVKAYLYCGDSMTTVCGKGTTLF